MEEKWTLSNLPPEGHKDLGEFIHEKVEDGEDEKVRLGLKDRWRYNHRMFRGDHWDETNAPKKNVRRLTMNLLFANIQRTIANLTARQPVVEAIEVGDSTQGPASDKILTAWLYKWWADTNQADSMLDTGHQMEIYGSTIEKYIFNGKYPDVAVLDPFSFGKAPGVFDDIHDAPYLYHKATMRLDEVEAHYGLEEGTVSAEETYVTLGEDRVEHNPQPNIKSGSMPVGSTTRERRNADSKSDDKALVTEVWIRDWNEGYPDGVRVITYTNGGKLILSDKRNPLINWALYEKDPALVTETFLWGRFAFSIGNSYKDKTTNWGFSALEQTSDINEVIDELVSRLYAYVSKSLLPVLIIPKDTGIKTQHINNKPGLILRPATSAQAGAIRYMDPPRISLDVYKFIDMLRGFFDVVWHIEDADRGERPNGIIAAQAIQALQERNAVLMRAKIRTIDKMVEHRGRAAISMLQNFGTATQYVKVEDESFEFAGLDLAGRDYKFVVESGSTVHKTMMQIQEQSIELFRMGAIDRQALLEAVDFPGWKSVIERTGENQLEQAMQILIDAGLEEEDAAKLTQYLMKKQKGEVDAEEN